MKKQYTSDMWAKLGLQKQLDKFLIEKECSDKQIDKIAELRGELNKQEKEFDEQKKELDKQKKELEELATQIGDIKDILDPAGGGNSNLQKQSMNDEVAQEDASGIIRDPISIGVRVTP
jgi:uncharacterized coiled-coil DUF342 family protein